MSDLKQCNHQNCTCEIINSDDRFHAEKKCECVCHEPKGLPVDHACCQNAVSQPAKPSEECSHCDDRFSSFHKECCLCGKLKSSAVEEICDKIARSWCNREWVSASHQLRALVDLVRKEMK